jgi:nucleotidyltransferase substrate binding protein (TIGR01987 family)
MSEKLILTPFQKALESLESVLAVPKDDIVRDATIHRFDYTYELARKMIKRHLKWAGTADADRLTRKSLFHEAARLGLIANAEVWFDYDEAKTLASQACDEIRAEEVYEKSRRFAVEAWHLLDRLNQHHG